MTKRLKRNRGLTLVESLVAVFLVGMTVASVLGTFTISRLSSSGLRTRMLALNLVRERMEEVKQLGYNGVTTSGTYPNVTIDDGVVSTAFFRTVANVGNCREVTITIQWTETKRITPVNLEESLSTIITLHP